MAEPTGGPSDRPPEQDEFEAAFARMTTPVADVTVPDSTGRPGESAPGTLAPAPSTSGRRATAERPPEAPPAGGRKAPTKTPPGLDPDAPAKPVSRRAHNAADCFSVGILGRRIGHHAPGRPI